MTKILLHGAGGRMGRAVAEFAKEHMDCKIVAGIDTRAVQDEFPMFPSLEGCDVSADVVIDFSNTEALEALLAYVEGKRLPLVLCTTGFSKAEEELIADASKRVPILRSANMSIGVNLLLSLVQKAALALTQSGFDIEIIEKHHNQKKDAPSGTALAIADAIQRVCEQDYHLMYDRSQRHEKREPLEIGMHAIRGGTFTGEHTVLFAGKDETISISHTALSREIFAAGAIRAAQFLKDKPAGIYSMADVLA